MGSKLTPYIRSVVLKFWFVTATVLSIAVSCLGQAIPLARAVQESATGSRITESGSRPFHLKATVKPANSFLHGYTADIEEYWVSPDKWRRTIKSESFTQTIVVNGNRRSETDSDDYYPKWLDDIVTALFEIVPQSSIDEFSKLSDVVESGKPGQVRYQPSSTDGKGATNAWWGSVAFGPGGELTRVFGKYFSATYGGYYDFHGKKVAHVIETFPPVPHGDVNTTVEVSDLGSVDETMFNIDRETPPDKQMRFIRMEEVEHRKLALDTPEMKWAPVKRQPVEGVLSMYIVTDTQGKVREANFITGNNMAMAENAEELIKAWRFKPVLVDGIPAEVESTMTFNYATTIEGDQAKYQAASYYFKRGRDLTYPRTDGSPAFHLKGTFSWVEHSATRRGSYEEFWYARNRWRREVTIGGKRAVETRIDDDNYVADVSRDIAELVQRADSLFGAEFPGYAYYSPDTDWHMDETELNTRSVLRVSMGPLDKIRPGEYPRAYYFDSQGIVLARSQARELIMYEDFQPWSGKQVPHTIKLFFGKSPVLIAHIDSLESAKPHNDDFFQLPHVKARDWVRPAPW